MENILFIVEGKKEEPLIIKTLISEFFKKQINAIISYNTNIHQLYDDLFEDGDIDIIRLLQQQGKLHDLSIRSDDIAEKYLFFDLDPHDPSFNFSKISELVDFFNNETKNGKLYINYPFSEALYEPQNSAFLTKKIETKKCKLYKKGLRNNFVNHSVVKSTYDNLVQKFVSELKKRGVTDIAKIPNKWKDLWYYRISLQDWKDVIRQHIDKAIHLAKYDGNNDLHQMIFDIQVAQNSTNGHIYILSIYGIFIYEYFKNWQSV
jgi:hypothetical protein